MKGRDAIVGRIRASKTTAFVTNLDFNAWRAFAHARTVSTTPERLDCPKSQRNPRRLVFKSLKAWISQLKNEQCVWIPDIMLPWGIAANT